MKHNLNEKLFTIFVIIAMVSLPIAEFIGLFFNHKFFYQEEILSTIGYLGCLLIVVYYIVKLYNKCTSRSTFVLSDVFLITSFIFCIISIVFSKNINKSLNGEYAYSETPLQVLAYFSLFFICTLISKEENKKQILKTFIILGILETEIAFLQNFGAWPVSSLFDPLWHTSDHLAFGLTEHCNYFAAISTIFTGVLATQFIHQDGKKHLCLYYILSIFSCLATLFTYTRIGWVGLFSVIFGIFFIEFCLYKKKKNKSLYKNHFKKFLIIAVSFFICFLIVGILSGQLMQDLLQSKKELSSDFSNFGTKRGTIWKVGLSSLKKYPFTGVGFDNYRYSFQIYPEKFGWSQNKGHNEYLHIFVTQGILSGINYLAFAFYCCYFPFKKILTEDTDFAKSDLTKIFLVALFAYFVQALFNSSVTNVAPYKWILMGLLLPRIEQKNLLKRRKQIDKQY